jgi:hypothetical protein
MRGEQLTLQRQPVFFLLHYGGVWQVISISSPTDVRIFESLSLRRLASGLGTRVARGMRRPDCHTVHPGQLAETLAFAVLLLDTDALFRGQRPLWGIPLQRQSHPHG